MGWHRDPHRRLAGKDSGSILRWSSQARFEPASQLLTVKISADQDQPVLFGSLPPTLVEGKPFADEMKDVSCVAFSHPQDAFAAKYVVGQVPIEKRLKFVHGQRLIGCERDGVEPVVR